MARTGIKIKRCNVGSVEAHNKRTKEYLEGLEKAGKPLYYFPDLSSGNTSWENPRYEGKSCQELFNDMIILYTEKVGQKPQLEDRERVNKKTGKKTTVAGWSPIREGCAPIKEDTTIEDFKPVIDWARENGLDVIRIDLHFDEGHTDAETKERKLNRHAHVVFDWLNHETSKTIKLDDVKMSELQDVMAAALGMERGEKKSVTNAEHKSAAEYREMKAAETARMLEHKAEELEERIESLTKIEAVKEEAISTVKVFGEKLRDKISGKDKREKKALKGQIEKLTEIAKNNTAVALSERERRVELESANQTMSEELKSVKNRLSDANKTINAMRDNNRPLTNQIHDLQKQLDNMKRNLPEVLPEATAIGLGIEDAVTLASGKEVRIPSLTDPDGRVLSMERGEQIRLRWNKRIEAYLSASWHSLKEWCREALRSPWCAVNGISNNPRRRKTQSL